MEIQIDANLRLRTLINSDAAKLFSVVDRNRQYLRQWLPWLDFNRVAADSLGFIRQQTEAANREEAIPLAIFYEEQLSGVAGFNWIDDKRSACALGYWISGELQGKGIVTRSVGALVEHAFRVMKLHRVEIQVATENIKSRALAERLGFQPIRTEEKAEWLYDHHVDAVVYELLRQDAS